MWIEQYQGIGISESSYARRLAKTACGPLQHESRGLRLLGKSGEAAGANQASQ
jgi:hypothetical protein